MVEPLVVHGSSLDSAKPRESLCTVELFRSPSQMTANQGEWEAPGEVQQQMFSIQGES